MGRCPNYSESCSDRREAHLLWAFVKDTRTKTYKVPNVAPATQEWLGMYKEAEYPEILGWGGERGGQ